MASESGDETGSSEIHIHKKQRIDDKTCSTMMSFDVLDCPVCSEPLTFPIYQCHNGHLACSSCCPKLSNKCPACALPIGKNRCIAMDGVLESILVLCPNAEFGCTKKVSYCNKSTHEKECTFSQCSCPELECDYTGSYKDLYNHFFFSTHKSGGFKCGKVFDVHMNIEDKICVKREYLEQLLFAVQCFREADGVYVTVSCIAPSAPEVGEFSLHLSYTMDGETTTYESTVKKILGVSSQRPEESYILIPHRPEELLEMKLCIKKLNKE